MYEKLNLFNGTILNSQHIAHIEDGIFDNSKAVEEKVAVAVETSYNQQTHIITFNVKNSLGEIISTSTIDLPTESAIININDIVINGKKYLRFTTVNGSTFDVEMDEMFINLVNEETFSNAIQNINEQILQLQTDVSNSKNDISNLKSFAENTNKSLANLEQTDIITNKRLANLESATLDFIEDSTIAYQKTVPENALPYAEVTKIGGMTRKCTNLIPFPYNDSSITVANVTWTVNDNGSISVSGTPSGFSRLYLVKNMPITPTVYTACAYGTYTNVECTISVYDDNSNVLVDYRILSSAVIIDLTSYSTAKTMTIAMKRSADGVATSGVIYPMLNIGETALPYEPYFEGLRSAPVSELVSEGANIIPFPYYDGASKTINGITFTVNGDGSVTISGTATANARFYIISETQRYRKPIVAGSYTGSLTTVDSYSNGNIRMVIGVTEIGEYYAYANGSNTRFTVKNDNTMYMVILVESGVTANTTVYPMLNKGTEALPYRPYFKRTLPIPEELRAFLEQYGYGQGNPDNLDEYNYIDFEGYFRGKGHIVDGVWVSYEEPIKIDISAYLTDDNFIDVEGGGSITAVNEFGYDVPTTISYVTKLGE